MVPPATGKRGRQRTFSDAAIQFCLSIKCLFGLALRQSLGMVESATKLPQAVDTRTGREFSEPVRWLEQILGCAPYSSLG